MERDRYGEGECGKESGVKAGSRRATVAPSGRRRSSDLARLLLPDAFRLLRALRRRARGFRDVGRETGCRGVPLRRRGVGRGGGGRIVPDGLGRGGGLGRRRGVGRRVLGTATEGARGRCGCGGRRDGGEVRLAGQGLPGGLVGPDLLDKLISDAQAREETIGRTSKSVALAPGFVISQ